MSERLRMEVHAVGYPVHDFQKLSMDQYQSQSDTRSVKYTQGAAG